MKGEYPKKKFKLILEEFYIEKDIKRENKKKRK